MFSSVVWSVSHLQNIFLRIPAYIALLISLLYLLRIIGKEDLLWIQGLITARNCSARKDVPGSEF